MRRVNSYTDDYETCVWYNIHRNCFQFRAQLFILHWEGTSYTKKRIFAKSIIFFFTEKNETTRKKI